jgi:feruloyl esterase
LTAPQVAAVKKMYAGPKNPRTGKQIIAGYSPGGESPPGDNWAGGWKMYVTDRKEPMRLDFWRYWVFNDPKWDWQTFDYDRDVARADEKLAAVNASSSDLSAFKRRGGKILMYSGWADPVGPPLDAVNFYQHVEQFIGSREKTESFFRLFVVPEWPIAAADPDQISSEATDRLLPYHRKSKTMPSTISSMRSSSGSRRGLLLTT